MATKTVPSKTEFLSSDDWKALVATGAAKGNTRDGFTLVYSNIDVALSTALLDRADVNTEAEFDTNALTLDFLVYKICGLPELDRTPPAGVAEEDWIDPYVGMSKVVTSRLRVQYDQQVQKQVLQKSRTMIAGKARRTVKNDVTGLSQPLAMQAWAVTESPDLVQIYITDPSISRALAQEKRKLKNSQSIIEAVPAAAATIIAALDVQTQAALATRAHTYQIAITGRTPAEIKALDAAIGQQVSLSRGSQGPALTAGTNGSVSESA